MISNTVVCHLLSYLGVTLYQKYSGDSKKGIAMGGAASRKDGPFRSSLARQVMWSLLGPEGVTLDGITDEIVWYQHWFIMFLISAPP